MNGGANANNRMNNKPEDADPSNDEEDIGDENEALPLSANVHLQNMESGIGSPGPQDKKRSR